MILPHEIPKFLPDAPKPRKAKEIRERDVEAYMVKRVKALGGECRKVKWIGRTGAPDRLVMLPGHRWLEDTVHPARKMQRESPGRTIWIELKAPGVPPKAHQLREHERMRKMGQRVEVVDSFERVDEVLQ